MPIFKKYCPICGMDVDKNKGMKRFGKYFCSEKHADEYGEKLEQNKSKTAGHGGGCCG